MSHDPVCEGEAVWSSKTKPCPMCAMFVKARDDEREQAVARILAACPHGRYGVSRECWHYLAAQLVRGTP